MPRPLVIAFAALLLLLCAGLAPRGASAMEPMAMHHAGHGAAPMPAATPLPDVTTAPPCDDPGCAQCQGGPCMLHCTLASLVPPQGPGLPHAPAALSLQVPRGAGPWPSRRPPPDLRPPNLFA